MTSPDTQPSVTVYEQPLNERMRTFLRLDFLDQPVDLGRIGEIERRQAEL